MSPLSFEISTPFPPPACALLHWQGLPSNFLNNVQKYSSYWAIHGCDPSAPAWDSMYIILKLAVQVSACLSRNCHCILCQPFSIFMEAQLPALNLLACLSIVEIRELYAGWVCRTWQESIVREVEDWGFWFVTFIFNFHVHLLREENLPFKPATLCTAVYSKL